MAKLALKYRDPAWVTRGEVGWVHRYRGGVIVHPTLRGISYRMLRAKTEDIFCFGYRPQPGDTVVELGAEYGTETLFLSRMVGAAGQVIAVEAHPRTCVALREMVRLNKLSNVTVVHAAVGDVSGVTTITDVHPRDNTVGVGGVEVPALSFRDLLARENISRVDLLKVNIEGAERALFAALTTSDAGAIRNIAVSCHDFRADAGDGESYRTGAVVDCDLARLGYQVTRRPTDPRPWVRDYRYASPPRPGAQRPDPSTLPIRS
jgi:FkbM family methyltransferase